jgi:hypothetical protein
MSKHTKGPWVVDGKHYRGTLDEHYHAITAGCGYHLNDEDDGFEIAGCISTANARLIAAAPELLEALEMAVAEYEKLPHSLGYEFTHLSAMRTAIAKARGKA